MAIPYLFPYALLLVFGLAAYYDYRFKRVPDLITSFGWFLIILNIGGGGDLLHSVAPLAGAGLIFGGVFFLNALCTAIRDNVLSWGDVLLLPVYAGYTIYLKATSEAVIYFVLLPFAVLFLYAVLKRTKTPAFAPSIFIAAIVVRVV